MLKRCTERHRTAKLQNEPKPVASAAQANYRTNPSLSPVAAQANYKTNPSQEQHRCVKVF